MGEGFLRAMSRGAVEVRSAGTRPIGLHPLAVRVMAEQEIDISHQRSKSVELFRDQAFDYVITVCDNAREQCPVFPAGTQRIHWSCPDPTATIGGEAEQLAAFRRVRDTLAERLRAFLADLKKDSR